MSIVQVVSSAGSRCSASAVKALLTVPPLRGSLVPVSGVVAGPGERQAARDPAAAAKARVPAPARKRRLVILPLSETELRPAWDIFTLLPRHSPASVAVLTIKA
jgi:hypothetical protein